MNPEEQAPQDTTRKKVAVVIPRAERRKKAIARAAELRAARGQPRGSASVIKKGEALNFVWGIDDSIVSVSGRILSIDVERKIDREPLQTTEGETDGMVYLDPGTSGTMDILIPDSFTEPDLASSLEVDGYDCFVETVKKRWESRGWAKYTIGFSGWDNVSVA